MPTLIRMRLTPWMLPLTYLLPREHRGGLPNLDNSCGGCQVTGRYRCLGAGRLVCPPRIEPMRSRRPRQLLERGKLGPWEETRLGSLVRRDAKLASLDLRPVHDHQDREPGPHPARDQAVKRYGKARLFSGLTHRGPFGRLVIFDETAGQRPMAVPGTVIQ